MFCFIIVFVYIFSKQQDCIAQPLQPCIKSVLMSCSVCTLNTQLYAMYVYLLQRLNHSRKNFNLKNIKIDFHTHTHDFIINKHSKPIGLFL